MRQLVPTKLGHPKTGVRPRVHHQSGRSERPLRPIVRPNHAGRACTRRNCSQCRTLGRGVSAFLALSGQVDGVFAARSLAVLYAVYIAGVDLRKQAPHWYPIQSYTLDFTTLAYPAAAFRFPLRQFRAHRFGCVHALPSFSLSAFACLAFRSCQPTHVSGH